MRRAWQIIASSLLKVTLIFKIPIYFVIQIKSISHAEALIMVSQLKFTLGETPHLTRRSILGSVCSTKEVNQPVPQTDTQTF